MKVWYDKDKAYWCAYYGKTDPRTKDFVNSRRTGFKTEAAARKGLKELIEEINLRIRDNQHPRWEALVDSFLTECTSSGLTKKTVYNTNKGIKAATLPRWEGRSIDSITTDEIRCLVLEVYSHSSESHRKAIFKFVRQAFDHAVNKGYLTRNPSPKLKFRIGKKLKTVLTYEQAKRLLSEAQRLQWEWYPHVFTALYTGMRSGELYALRWDRVDLLASNIRVDQSWNNKDGFKCTKSGEGRIVDMSPDLVKLFRQLKLKSEGGEFVLPRIGRWDKGEQARELRIFLEAIGVPSVRFHDLRATWATLMLNRGVEPVKVMTMGGWSSMNTMMRYIREAGIDIKGIAQVIQLHDPSTSHGQLFELRANS